MKKSQHTFGHNTSFMSRRTLFFSEMRANVNTGFKPAHKRNKKYTEGYMIPLLEKMYKVLATDPNMNLLADNSVWANNIKFKKNFAFLPVVIAAISNISRKSLGKNLHGIKHQE